MFDMFGQPTYASPQNRIGPQPVPPRETAPPAARSAPDFGEQLFFSPKLDDQLYAPQDPLLNPALLNPMPMASRPPARQGFYPADPLLLQAAMPSFFSMLPASDLQAFAWPAPTPPRRGAPDLPVQRSLLGAFGMNRSV